MTITRPKKSLGQNFLVDPNYRRKIITAVRENFCGETIVEIGPGRGALTDGLLSFAGDMILVEKDRYLAHPLVEKFHSQNSVKVIRADFLEIDFESILPKPPQRMIAVGNLPYNVASQIYLKLLHNRRYFKRLYLMFQKEVAVRCLAAPGGRDYGVLSVWTQIMTRGRKLFDVPPTAFRPRPRVTSSFVAFELLDDDGQDWIPFMAFVRRLFQNRRKKTGTILKSMFGKGLSTSCALHLTEKRPEKLSLNELKTLFELFCPQNGV